MSRILLEGNIGTGKSTMGKALHGKLVSNAKVHFVKEPVSLWTNSPRGNLLAKCSQQSKAGSTLGKSKLGKFGL